MTFEACAGDGRGTEREESSSNWKFLQSVLQGLVQSCGAFGRPVSGRRRKDGRLF